MTMDDVALSEELRALMKVLQLDLPEYSADPIFRRRVGRALAETSTYARPARKDK